MLRSPDESRPLRILFFATERGRKTLYALQQTPNVEIDFFEMVVGGSVLTRLRELVLVLRRLVGKNPPQIVLWDAFSIVPYLLSQLARRRGIYNFVRLRGDIWTEFRGISNADFPPSMRIKWRAFAWIATRMVRECDLLLPVSHFLGNRAIAATGIDIARYRPLSTYIDSAWFIPEGATEQAVARYENGVGDKRVILTITNFNFWKKVEPLLHFIPVYVELQKTHPNLLWVIGGSGKYLSRFQSRLETALGVDAPVLLPGRLNAASWIRACDLFVYFTGLDGLPNVVMEAGAAGKVVVANLHPSVCEIIRDQETGFLINLEDHPAVYALIDKLLNSPTLRQDIGKAAREHIQASYSAEAVAAKFQTILEDLIPVYQ